MGRSGYSDDCDGWALIRWRGAVASSIRGARGQQFLRDIVTALDAMPIKRLIRDELEANGDVCALGSVGTMRGVNMALVDPYDRPAVARLFRIAPALAAETMFENDVWRHCNPEERWIHMRAWAEGHIRASTVNLPPIESPGARP